MPTMRAVSTETFSLPAAESDSEAACSKLAQLPLTDPLGWRLLSPAILFCYEILAGMKVCDSIRFFSPSSKFQFENEAENDNGRGRFADKVS